MGKHYLFEAVWMLLLITTLSSGVCGICWDCLPKNLSEEDIDKILLDDFRDRLLKKLGLTREPVVPENVIRPPQELLNQISLEDEAMYANDDTEVLKTAILQPLNNDSKISDTTSFFEYRDINKREDYRVEHVTLWLHVKTGLCKVYEKVSALPPRLVFMEEYHTSGSEWKKITFTPSRRWLENPWRKLRLEIQTQKLPEDSKPFLQINLKRKERRLRKRHASQVSTTTTTGDCQPTQTLCCKHNKVLNLQAQFPWIYLPQSYDAFNCMGKCVISHRNNNTWSFLMQSGSSVRSPCCAPTAFEPMSILYYDDRNGTNTGNSLNLPIVHKLVHDFKVKSCGCL